MKSSHLQNEPKPAMFRVNSPRNDSPKIVDREGGDYGAGIIRGMSAISRGEALGHGTWIDDVFLSQVADALAAAGNDGVKSRFTHPDMSADGLAKFLGRAKTGRAEDGRVFTDLHLAKSAHKSPDGDLAGYVMDRTEEDSASFGASIVFYRDEEAEDALGLEHGAMIARNEWGQEYVDYRSFKSPDPLNTGNLPHVRLLSLEAADLVDEPAANPNGMFHTNPVGEFAELADYALGLADKPPSEATALAVNPDRLRGFVSRYLENRNMRLTTIAEPVDETPADDTTPTPAAETAPEVKPEPDGVPADEQPAGEPQPVAQATGPDKPLADYCAAFGDAAGARFFLDGVKFSAAQQTVIDSLRAENATLQARLELANKEHPHPLNIGNGNKKSLRDLVRQRGN